MTRIDPLIALELPAEPRSVKVARDAVGGLDGHFAGSHADVVLIISELVTNCVRHAELDPSQPVLLSVNIDGDEIQIAVRDPGIGFEPPPPPEDPMHVGGWGLVLVGQLSESWGVTREDGVTVVWCVVRRRS